MGKLTGLLTAHLNEDVTLSNFGSGSAAVDKKSLKLNGLERS